MRACMCVLCMCVCVCAWVCVHACVHVRVHVVYMCVCVCLSVHECVCLCVCVCMYMCVFACALQFSHDPNVLCVSMTPSTCFDCCVADDHPDVQLAFGGEELEDVYGSAKLRKEVTTHKLEPHQVVLEELKLGTVEPPQNRIQTRTRLNRLLVEYDSTKHANFEGKPLFQGDETRVTQQDRSQTHSQLKKNASLI